MSASACAMPFVSAACVSVSCMSTSPDLDSSAIAALVGECGQTGGSSCDAQPVKLARKMERGAKPKGCQLKENKTHERVSE